MKLSSCIEMMFAELPFAKRIQAAKDAGFDGYEFWGWYGKDLVEIADAQAECGLPLAACGIGSRDESRRSALKGGIVRRGNASAFAETVAESIEATGPLGVKTLLVTTGNELSGVCREAQAEAVAEALSAAAPIAVRAGVTLALEPLNVLVDHGGYFLSRSSDAFAILMEVASDSVRLLFDIYHQQITEGSLIQNITEGIARIGHFHLADVPGRHQPGTGEINYDNVMAAIGRTGYGGYVGCEYVRTAGVSEVEGARAILSYAHRG